MINLNIIVMASASSWGGTENWAVQMSALLMERGHNVQLIYAYDIVGNEAKKKNITAKKIKMHNDIDFYTFFKLYRFFKKNNTDALITTKWREYFLATLAAKLAGVPQTVMSLGLKVNVKDDLKRKIIFKTVDKIDVNALEIKKDLLRHEWIPAEKIHVIYNGVDLDVFNPDKVKCNFRKELGLSKDDILIGNIAAFTPQKGHIFFLESIPLVLNKYPNAKFVFVGDGFLRSEIENKIEELNIVENVILTGFRTDIPDILNSLDIFALSSNNEGMAWVILEAMAMKKAIVTTNVSGISESIIEGETGLVTEYNDNKGFADSIISFIDDKEMRLNFGEKARTIAEQKFNTKKMVDETESMLLTNEK